MPIEKPSAVVPKLRFPEFDGAAEWKPQRLDEVSSSIFDGTHQTPTYTEEGVPFYSVENLISGTANKFISRDDYLEATRKNKPEKGDILLTRIGKIGHSQAVTWDHEFSVYVTLAVIKASPGFDTSYLAYYLQSGCYQTELIRKSLQSAVPPKINLDSLRSTLVLLPDMEEQVKIADCLGSLHDLIAAEDRKIEALRQHKQGLMQQLFPQPGETVPRLRFPEFQDPLHWDTRPLRDLAHVIAGQSPSGKNYNTTGSGVPFYQGKTDFGDIYLKKPTKWTTQVTKLAQPSDILMSVRAPVGALNISTEQICIGRGLASLQSRCDKWFLYYALLAQQSQIIGNGGSVFDSINKKQIEDLPIVAPPTIAEQVKIADCLGSLDDLITAEGRKLEALRQHKQGLMHQLFPSLDGQ